MRVRLLYRRAETALLIPEGRSRFQAPNRQIRPAPPTVPKLKGVSPLSCLGGGETRQVSLCLSGLQLRARGRPSGRARKGPPPGRRGIRAVATAQLPSAIRVPRSGASCPESTLGEQGKGRRPDRAPYQRERWRRPNSSPCDLDTPAGGFMRGVDESYRRSAGEKRGPPPTAAQWATTTAGDDPVMSPALPRYPGPGASCPGRARRGRGNSLPIAGVGRRKRTLLRQTPAMNEANSDANSNASPDLEADARAELRLAKVTAMRTLERLGRAGREPRNSPGTP